MIQKAKFEYSPLGKVFNKGLDESEKEEGLLERLKNIEGKNEEQLKAIKDRLQILTKKKDKEVDFRNLPFRDKLDSKSKKTYDDFKEKSERINSTKLVCIGSGKHQYNFTIILDLKSFANNIYNGSLSLEAAKIKERNMKDMIRRLDEYKPRNEKFKAQKERTLLNAREFYKGRIMIPIAFQNGTVPLPRQHPSGMHGWKEDEIGPLYILPDESRLSSAESRRIESEIKIMLENIDRSKSACKYS